MDKWEYQNKPCYLENHVVREPCKQRTACILNILSMFLFMSFYKKINSRLTHFPRKQFTLIPSRCFLMNYNLVFNSHCFNESIVHLYCFFVYLVLFILILPVGPVLKIIFKLGRQIDSDTSKVVVSWWSSKIMQDFWGTPLLPPSIHCYLIETVHVSRK